jgi:hypothetical protein
VKQLIEALKNAQTELGQTIGFDSRNPHFSSKFVSLAACLSEIVPVLLRNDLVLIQQPGLENNIATLKTTIFHVSGENISSVAGAPLAKNDAQAYGSAITYLRRYSLLAIMGIAGTDDDDANGCSMPPAPKKGPAPAPAPATAKPRPPFQPAKAAPAGARTTPAKEANKTEENPDAEDVDAFF